MKWTERLRDIGILLIRIGLGASFIIHGFGKFQGGPKTWTFLGESMSYYGINFLPTMWGFFAALTEFGGGLFLLLGLFFRPTLVLMSFTMFTALQHHIVQADPFTKISHPLELLVVFVGLMFIGPGFFSADGFRNKRKQSAAAGKAGATADPDPPVASGTGSPKDKTPPPQFG